MMFAAVHDTAVMAIDFNLTPQLPPGAPQILRLVNWGLWAALLGCASAIIVSGVKMGWEKWHQGTMQAPKMLLGACVGAIVSGSANVILNAVG